MADLTYGIGYYARFSCGWREPRATGAVQMFRYLELASVATGRGVMHKSARHLHRLLLLPTAALRQTFWQARHVPNDIYDRGCDG